MSAKQSGSKDADIQESRSVFGDGVPFSWVLEPSSISSRHSYSLHSTLMSREIKCNIKRTYMLLILAALSIAIWNSISVGSLVEFRAN
jgi:hypothetical protein